VLSSKAIVYIPDYQPENIVINKDIKKGRSKIKPKLYVKYSLN